MRRSTSLPAALLLVPLLLAPLACGPGEDGGAEATSPGDGDYTVRGEITRLPEGDGPMMVRHEPIPDFVSMDGEVVGMEAMTMPFPLADGVSLAGLAPGDRVEFDLEVRWEGSPPYRITRVEELDAAAPAAADETAMPSPGAGHDTDAPGDHGGDGGHGNHPPGR